MKHVIPIIPWSYSQILEGKKKIQLAVFDKVAQQVRVNDEIEFENVITKERLSCVVNGFVIFENFEMMIDTLPPELFGYDNRKEVKVRVNRLFPKEETENNFAVGFFIRPILPDVQKIRSPKYNFERVPEHYQYARG